jgi:ABC-type multidrug transport system fused ATPase/permease subunit
MKTLKRLLLYVKPYWKTLFIAAFMLIVGTGLSLIPPLIQRSIIDDVIDAGKYERLLSLLGLLIAVYALQQLAGFVEQYLRHLLGAQFIFDLRVRIYNHLQNLSLSFYEQTSTGELMSRVTSDVDALEHFVTHGVAMTAVDLLRLLGASIVLLTLEWRLACLVLLPVPLIVIGLRRFNQRVRPIYRKARDRLGEINARLQDNLTGIRVIQAFVQEKFELDNFREASRNYFHERVRSIRAWSTLFPVLRFLVLLGSAMVLGGGTWLILNQQLTLGTLVAFLTYTTSFYDPLHRLTEIDNIIQQAIASGERIFELLDQESEIKDMHQALSVGYIQGDIVFNNVDFNYGDAFPNMAQENRHVLSQVSFHIAPGEVVALVGPSGAGKTSIARLLCRFYDPINGEVRVDGHDIRTIQIASLRKHVAVVLQDTFLFNTSVKENLRYGKPDATDDEIEIAAKTAFAHDFILQLPDGYDTEIGERGVKLSGGQKQRLSLARAILADPRILILDEATSSVDAEAEYLIQRALDEVMKGRTSLVIAHRLSTIRNADKIIALEEGHIREIGDHAELLARGGLYSHLYQRQLSLTAHGAAMDADDATLYSP